MNHPVIARTCAAFSVDPVDLIGPSRARHVCEARNAAAWVLKRTGISGDQIGLLLGQRDHSTIYHAIQKADELLHLDPRYAQRVRRVMEAR